MLPNFVSRTKGSKLITKAGGATIDLALETTKLIRFLFRAIPMSEPNVIILKGMVNRAAINYNWRGIRGVGGYIMGGKTILRLNTKENNC